MGCLKAIEYDKKRGYEGYDDGGDAAPAGVHGRSCPDGGR